MAFAGAVMSILAVLLSLLVQPHESPIVAAAPRDRSPQCILKLRSAKRIAAADTRRWGWGEPGRHVAEVALRDLVAEIALAISFMPVSSVGTLPVHLRRITCSFMRLAMRV